MYQCRLFALTLSAYFAFCDRKEFRNDYRYHASVDGWMKLHRVPQTWSEARAWCHYEGSILASPISNEMIAAMIKEQTGQNDEISVLFSRSGSIPLVRQQTGQNEVSVFTGISAYYSKGVFFSVEGISLDQIPVTWAPSEPDNIDAQEQCMTMNPNGELADVNCDEPRPFICYKKNSTHIPAKNKCGTVDPEYKFDTRTGNCYKIHRFGLTWPEAFKACVAEGGYLAIINSDVEANVLKDVMAKYPSHVVMAHHKDFLGVGFRDWTMKGTQWMTVHGQTLKEAGYERWGHENPNSPSANKLPWVDEFCGVAFRDALLGDLGCNVTIPFICEMEQA